ncbi:MAG: DUF1194 domain-containing protein [Aestuariivirgaceae bacterium]
MAGRALSAAACLLVTLAQQAPANEVGLELVLAIDCSLSVSDPEYHLQMGGIAAALRSPSVRALILDQPAGVALTVLQWSGTATTHQAVPWRLLATPQDVEAFAAETAAAPRPPLSYYTAIGHAIAAGIRSIEGNDFQGRERKIDISGDGRSNAGPPPGLVRQLAIRRGITVNGLAILTDDPDLADYYAGEVSGGPGSFTVTASDYRDFAQAFARKLYRELLPRTAGRGRSLAMGGR